MIEWIIAFAAILLVATVITAVEYYKHLAKAKMEYEKAKNVVEDIVLSFNRELRKDTEKLEIVAYKIEGNLGKTESTIKKVEDFEKKIVSLETQVSEVSKEYQHVTPFMMGISTKIQSVETTQETLRAQVAKLGDQIERLSVMPEIQSEQVMPIKRDKALATLTDTEIEVLEMLSAEGSKTAPEIKDRVQLSREHTSRVMKKLYEEGYVERETGKIPFKYSVKKEMERFLKKPETAKT